MQENMNEELVPHDTKIDKMPKTPKSAWLWFTQNPCERWPFIMFILCFILAIMTLIIFFIPQAQGTAFTIISITVIVVSGYGSYHFRVLLAIKEQVDKYSKLNNQFKTENTEMRHEVDKLSKACEQLVDIESKLKESNKLMKSNLEKFEQLNENLTMLGEDNIAGLEKLQEQSKAIAGRWKDSLVKHEKGILNKVYDQFEFKDDKEDMNKEEFNAFIKALPSNYQTHWRQMGKTFEDFAGDDDCMQYEEFRQLVDEWAENEANHK